jgi:hypothetical protein
VLVVDEELGGGGRVLQSVEVGEEVDLTVIASGAMRSTIGVRPMDCFACGS